MTKCKHENATATPFTDDAYGCTQVYYEHNCPDCEASWNETCDTTEKDEFEPDEWLVNF